jgi:hypothetical protein
MFNSLVKPKATILMVHHGSKLHAVLEWYDQTNAYAGVHLMRLLLDNECDLEKSRLLGKGAGTPSKGDGCP